MLNRIPLDINHDDVKWCRDIGLLAQRQIKQDMFGFPNKDIPWLTIFKFITRLFRDWLQLAKGGYIV